MHDNLSNMRLAPQTRAVLTTIQHDADVSLQQISIATKLPIHVIQYQIAKLRDEGIIRRGAIMNHARIGLQLHQVYLIGGASFYKFAAEIGESFRKSPLVNWYAQLGGEFQVGISIVAKSAFNLAFFFDKLADKFLDPIADKRFSTVLEHFVYKKRYFLSEKKLNTTQAIEVSSNVNIETVDKLDREVLGVISDSSVFTNAEMAKKIGIARSTFEYRLNRLKETKVIERSVYYINSRKLGYLTYRVLVAVQGNRALALNRIKSFCAKETSVTFLIYSLGAWDFEIVVEVLEPSSVMQVVSNLQLSCGDIIERVQSLPVYEQSTSLAFLSHFD